MTTSQTSTTIDPALLDQLRSAVSGSVLTPGADGYDAARTGWNLAAQQRPAVIVTAQSAADVVEAVRFANAADLGIGVMATGHGMITPANGHLLIVTSAMDGVQIDADAQTARVEAGAKWSTVLEPAQVAGLAPLLGSSPTVGVVGYTLGGGMGWLARKYGMMIDSVIAFEIVTPDGTLRRVSASENSELFWALRGGGGSFGVVTGLEFKLHPVTTVYGGSLIYPAELAQAVLARFRAWIADAPDEQTSSVALMNLPPLPIVPEFLRGKSVVMVNACHCGAVSDGEARVQPWLDWQAPIASTFRPMPFGEVAAISNDPQDPVPGISSGAWLRDLDDDTIQTLIAQTFVTGGPPPLLKTEVRHAGGAIARAAGDNPYSHREAQLALQMVGMAPSPEAKQGVLAHIAAFKAALAPHLTGGVYLNFLEGDEARARTRDAYDPAAYQRLTTLKAQFDPDNRLRFAHDLTPDAAAD